MLQIKLLPAVQTSEPTTAFVWGLGHGLLFAGGLLLVLTLTVLAILAWKWPARAKLSTTSEQIQAYSRSLSPAASVRFYREHIANGLDGGGMTNPFEKDYEDHVMQSKIGLILLVTLALIAVGLIASGAWWVRRPTKQRAGKS